MRALSTFLSAASLTALAACASNPQPAQPGPQPAAARPAAPAQTATPAPTPAAAPAAVPAAPAGAAAMDLSGTWDFSVDAGGQTVPGEITLQRNGASYTGTVSPQGMSPATIRTMTIQGERVSMVVDAPDGEAVFNITVSADGRSMTGSVSWQGQELGFTARRR